MKLDRTSRPALRFLSIAVASLALAGGTATAQELSATLDGVKRASWNPEAQETVASNIPCDGTESALGPAVVVKAGSNQCGAAGIYEPVPAEAVTCLQAETRQYLWEQYQLGALRPGTKLSATEVESRILARPIPVQMYAWPVYLELGAEGNQPWSGCAAGIAWQNEIWVSLKDGNERSMKLVAWETANNIVAWGLDRHDLGDSTATVAAAANRAYAVCTATPYAMR